MKLRFLLSYHYFKKKNLDALFLELFGAYRPDIFLDSGAWSAFSQGVEIDIDAYCKFIHKYNHLITVYCNLDVIGSSVKTLKNQRIMESNGLKPLPVFHTGEDFKVLERYCEEYDYIGLGGLVPYKSKKKIIIPWLVKCFKVARKHQAVFHGLGVTGWLLLNSFTWYSVDSSAWNSGVRFGTLDVFDSIKKSRFCLKSRKSKDYTTKDTKRLYNRRTSVAKLGYDYKTFHKDFLSIRRQVLGIGAISTLFMEKHLRSKFGLVRCPKRENGLKIYLASSTKDDFIGAFNESKDKGFIDVSN